MQDSQSKNVLIQQNNDVNGQINQLIGNQHQHSINIIQQKIPYIFSSASTQFLAFIGQSNTQEHISRPISIIKQCDHAILHKFYSSEEQGNVITTIYKLKTIKLCQIVMNRIKQQYPDINIIFCVDPFQFEIQKSKNKVSLPQNSLLKKLIDKLAIKVAQEGYFFQKQLIKLNHPHFEFLKHKYSCQYQYYRMKCVEYLSNPYNSSQLASLQLQKNSKIYYFTFNYPPPQLLTQLKRQIFVELIKQVDFSRQKIGKVMIFALNNSDCSSEISYTLCKTPLANAKQMLLRIYIISDILHNSLALSYPGLFRVLLPNFLFNCFKTYQVTQQLKTRLFQVLNIWKQKLSVYELQFFQGLEFTINHLVHVEDNSQTNSYWHPSIINKSQQQIQSQCWRLGIPTVGEYPLYLSMFLHQDDIKRQGRVENIYDGEDLTEQDVKKIKGEQIDVMTFHSLNYLNLARKNFKQ